MDELLKVQVGRHVEVELVEPSGEADNLAFDIVADKQADFKLGFLGEGTPLARAILGKGIGDEVSYQAEVAIKVRILSVQRSTVKPPADAATQREAAMRKAEAEIQRRSAITFASSYSSKWGDYDPKGVEKWEDEE